MTILGADPEQLERMAQTLLGYADEYSDAGDRIDRWLRRTGWRGTDADRFFGFYESRMRPQISTAADTLRSAASELRAQAEKQTRASKTGVTSADLSSVDSEPCLALGPHAVRSEGLLISSSGHLGVGFYGAREFPTEVVFREMSDGTFRVSIQSSDIASIGGNLVEGPGRFDYGMEANLQEGFILEFEASTPEGAQALRDVLEGRASSFTNRTVLGGGVGLDEVLGQDVLDRDDVVQVSTTGVSSLSGGTDRSVRTRGGLKEGSDYSDGPSWRSYRRDHSNGSVLRI